MSDRKVKLSVFPKVILRIPRIPVSGTLQEFWDILKQLIKESSPEFFRIIECIGYEQLSKQPIKVQETVWKYFNRARHRSTPFGGFAGVCLSKAAYQPGGQVPIVVKQDPEYLYFNDWSEKEEVSYTYRDLLDNNGMLFSNSTAYRLPGDIIRYVGQNGGKFELLEVRADTFLSEILNLCGAPISLRTVVGMFPQYDAEALQAHIESLVDIQLLYTSMDSNIIGEDYFSRIGRNTENRDRSYTITSREHVSGTFDLRRLKHLDQLFDSLSKLLVPTKGGMLDFADRFSKRYDLQEVPLMVALDPQYGIGYGNLDRPFTGDDIVFELAGAPDSPQPDRLLRSLLAAFGNTPAKGLPAVIDLEDVNCEPESNDPLPNSVSILFSIAHGDVWINSIGGASANALLGRFTHASDDIYALTRDIAAIEESANEEVAFFDIGYEAEGHVDNVNRRRRIYSDELVLLSYSTSDRPLQLKDVVVSVRAGEIILKSRSTGKRLIPRLASAYNHTRSDLSVFRFLCDLQHQGVRSSFNFKIHRVLPGLKYYPCIRFRQYIVSPRTWILQRDDLVAHTGILRMLRGLDVPRYVRTGDGDQLLYFDLREDKDADMLERIIRKQAEVILEEAPTPDTAQVLDENGRPYSVQYLATAIHRSKVYKQAASGPVRKDAGVRRYFISGLHWHYFEIYCHPLYADQLLTGTIAPFLERNREQVTAAFFIRYNEGGDHIRFRFRTVNSGDNLPVKELLCSLDELMASGHVSDVQQKVYNREIERYGPDLIESVEQLFCADSAYVLDVLGLGLDDYGKYALCVSLVHHILDCSPDESGLSGKNREMLRVYEQEHLIGSGGYRKLNALFRRFQRSAPFDTISRIGPKTGELASAIVELLDGSLNMEKLYADLIHMHINRLFPFRQRTHELAVYYILDKIRLRKTPNIPRSDQMVS